MNIDLEFNQILLQYGIIQTTDLNSVKQFVKKLREKISDDSKIGLYGAGKEALNLLQNIIAFYPELKIDKCFDRSVEKFSFQDVVKDNNVEPIEKIIDDSYDFVLIGSRNYSNIFKENLKQIGFEGQIIDFYDYMESYIDDHFSDHKRVFSAKQKFLLSSDKEKPQTLANLIRQFLLIKDFLNFEKYTDLYIEYRLQGYEKYVELKQSIKDFINKIKNFLNERKKNDVVINWIDALSYYDIDQFDFLSREAKKGTFFENAYTVIPWTSDTMRTILSGEYPIDGETFLIKGFTEDNSPLLQCLYDRGYQFGYCGLGRISTMYRGSCITPFEIYDTKYTSSTTKQWEALKMLCESEKPLCIIVHNLYETHEPFISGDNDTFIEFGGRPEDWADERCRKQAAISGEYIDRQLNFYAELYGNDVTRIYMSDHGRIGNLPMNDEKIHIVLFVSGGESKKTKIKEMFSLIDTNKLILNIIDRHELNDKEYAREYVMIENLDAYSKSRVERALNGVFDKKEVCQCRGVVTMQDSFFRYFSGDEYYFLSKDTTKNEIDNSNFKARIDELRNVCGNKFVDIYHYDKFENSKLLYK